jgi:hypothetical protein
MDPTGLHLVPADNHTYEKMGSQEVRVIGGDDKRQITVCVGSSMNGDLLPLQLIFQGKTQQCLPARTPEAAAAGFHLTKSENHWSSLETMKEYIVEVIVPYTKERIKEHKLHADSHVVLVLDVWSVHKSADFRSYMKQEHPHIHLVYVPPNCTSKLQVADVMLQRPFKSGIKKHFNAWVAEKVAQQIEAENILGLSSYLKMAFIKPLILQWCVDSWSALRQQPDMIRQGWDICHLSLFDALNEQKRQEAVEQSALQQFSHEWVPEGKETEPETTVAYSDSDDEGELDLSKERKFGTRKNPQRQRQLPKDLVKGMKVDPCQIDFGLETGVDTDADGMPAGQRNKKKSKNSSKKKGGM